MEEEEPEGIRNQMQGYQNRFNSTQYDVGEDDHRVLNSEEAIRNQQARMYQDDAGRGLQPENSMTH